MANSLRDVTFEKKVGNGVNLQDRWQNWLQEQILPPNQVRVGLK
jgi:hypothetical protein